MNNWSKTFSIMIFFTNHYFYMCIFCSILSSKLYFLIHVYWCPKYKKYCLVFINFFCVCFLLLVTDFEKGIWKSRKLTKAHKVFETLCLQYNWFVGEPIPYSCPFPITLLKQFTKATIYLFTFSCFTQFSCQVHRKLKLEG